MAWEIKEGVFEIYLNSDNILQNDDLSRLQHHGVSHMKLRAASTWLEEEASCRPKMFLNPTIRQTVRVPIGVVTMFSFVMYWLHIEWVRITVPLDPNFLESTLGYHAFPNNCRTRVPSSTVPCISSSCTPRISNFCSPHVLGSRQFMYFWVYVTTPTQQLMGHVSLVIKIPVFPTFEIYELSTPWSTSPIHWDPCHTYYLSSLYVTWYCSHVLKLDSCATLDVVFTRAVYGAATEPRAPCVRPSLGCVTRCALVSRLAKAWRHFSCGTFISIFYRLVDLYTSDSWR